MRRVAILFVLLAVVGLSLAVVIDLAVKTDEELIEGMLEEVVTSRGKSAALLRYVDLEAVPLEVSIGPDTDRYSSTDINELLWQAGAVDATLGDRPIDVRQSEIQVRGDDARVIANLVVEDRGRKELLPCDVSLQRAGNRWVLKRVRLML